MGRIARVVVPGIPVHITQRGNCGRDVFLTDQDRRIYLSKLKFYATKYELDVLGYCLMTNHVHIIAVPLREDSLAKALGRAHNDYSRWLHIRLGQIGHLWQNRFFSCVLEEDHLWQALHYVELNPVRAGLVSGPADWPWSSATAHTGGRDFAEILTLDRWQGNYSAMSWRSALLSSLTDEAFAQRLREATRTGRPIGSEGFVSDLERVLDRTLHPEKPGKKPAAAIAQATAATANSAIA